MKKKYVNLNVEVVDVQLSDCIAGSKRPVGLTRGTSVLSECDATSEDEATEGGMIFKPW